MSYKYILYIHYIQFIFYNTWPSRTFTHSKSFEISRSIPWWASESYHLVTFNCCLTTYQGLAAPWFRFCRIFLGKAPFFSKGTCWRCWRMINLFIHHSDSEKIDWKGRICTNMAIQNTSSLKSLWCLPNLSQVPGYINYLTALYKWRHLPFSPRNS